MQGSGSTTRPRRLGAAGVLLATLGLVATGCSDSDDPVTPGPTTSSAKPSASPSGTPVAGRPLDGEAMFKTLVTAMTKAGGCEMTATVGAVKVSATFALGRTDEMGFISTVATKGTVTSADDKKADFVADLGQRFAGTGYYIDDGAPVEGKKWALVPRNTSRILDQAAVVKTHPLYLLVPQAVPLVEPDNIATLMSVRKGLVKADDSTAAKPHYVWSVDGKPPVIGSANVYQLWTDAKNRPVRFVGQVRGADLEATYRDWGKTPRPDFPAAADAYAVPTDGGPSSSQPPSP